MKNDALQKAINLISKHAPVIQAKHKTSQPNDPIILYEGELKLTQEGKIISEEKGSLTLTWLPQPSIRFELPFSNIPRTGESELIIKDFPTTLLSAFITNYNIGSVNQCKGILWKSPKALGNESKCDKILFHIPNFHKYISSPIRSASSMKQWMGRFILQLNDWNIIIDEQENTESLIHEVKNNIGYVITHVAEIRHSQNITFSLSQVETIIDSFWAFLSFSRGFRCGPILISGSLENKEMFQKWQIPSLSSWKSVWSWFPLNESLDQQEMSSLFQKIFTKSQDPLWASPILQTVHWYVEANNNAGGIEGSIVLTQTALEMLSWLYTVEDKNSATINRKEFKKKTASEKLRYLLEVLNIPTDIPTELCELNKLANDLKTDGPEIFVRLRNAIVHPKKIKRELIDKTSNKTRREAWTIGLWYLELVLLKICEYQGRYVRRYFNGNDIFEAISDIP